MSKLTQTILGLTAVTVLSACSSTDNSSQELAIAQQHNQLAFVQCQGHVMNMDHSARDNGSLAQYLSSANAGTQCLDDAFDHNPLIPEQQKMQLQALVVLNYVKGGDVAKAHDGLTRFTHNYTGKDLYFADNTSFIDTFALLLSDPIHAAEPASLNVNKQLVSELKRKQIWLNR